MKEFYKILHEDQKHFGMQYHLGLNEDVEPFDETPYCEGGIFFAEKEHVFDYLTYGQGTKLAIIEIPEGEKIIQVDDKYKAHRIIIKDIKNLWTDENYEWLVSYFEINDLFQYACKNGALSIAKELDKNHIVDVHTNNDYAFQWACNNGHLEVAKWLHKLGANIHELNDAAFRWSCENGHLEVAKWLYDLGDVDIHAMDEYAFQGACNNGHLEVAQWLYDLGDVDIHTGDDFAFQIACENGHLEVAKWIYSLGDVDIHADDDCVFEVSSEEIITWLSTL